MGIKQVIKDVKKEAKVLFGQGTKDKRYVSHQKYSDKDAADRAFKKSKAKLFHVEQWSELPGLASKFELYNHGGERYRAEKPQIGDFIRILLPLPVPENWVKITDIQDHADKAEFTVHPSRDPQESDNDIEHFFVDEASSTFKVERKSNTIYAYEIGKDEGINNRGEEAGDRGLLNTILSEGGWLAFQEMQWEKLTTYLVHKPV